MLFSPGFLGYKKLLSDSLKETSENIKTLAVETVKGIPEAAGDLAIESGKQTAKGLKLMGAGAAGAASAAGRAVMDAVTPDPKPELIEVPDGQTPDLMEQGVLEAPLGMDTPKPKAIARGIDLSDDDIDELKHVLYSEIGNRSQEKRSLEADVVINTALNRVTENRSKGRGPQTLKEVLRQDNQYQGLGTKQYEISKSGKGEARKNEAIDAALARLKSGELEDNTNGAFYYIHNDDGTITYDDTRPLYAK